MAEIFTVENLIAFLTLTSLEIVLGIDNIVFIAIITGKLPTDVQDKARRLGLLMAMGMRIMLLFFISWIMQLTAPLFTILGNTFSGRDLILLVGGLFLIGKATHEIHAKIEGVGEEHAHAKRAVSFRNAIIQIMLLDLVFSLDSVITAVGMVDQIAIMIAAVITSVGVMLVFAGPIASFIERHPTFKMLALSFLLLIGLTLFLDGFGRHIEKGYIYFAMGFSLLVEILNMRVYSKKAESVNS